MTQTQALLWTLCLEAPVAASLAASTGAPRAVVARTGLVAVAGSLLTHPLLWLADARLEGALSWPVRLALLEGAVVLVEGVAYALAASTGWRLGFALALAANAASLAAGFLLHACV